MRTRRIVPLLGALVATATVVGMPASPAHAANFSMVVHSPVTAGIGVDDPNRGMTYDPCNFQVGPNGTVSQSVGATASKIRVELYPGGCAHKYDPWGNVGGIQFEVPRNSGGNYDIGPVRLPVAPHDGFKIQGDIIASGRVADERVKVDTFQVAGHQQNGKVSYGAFASTTNLGNRWTGGVGWDGRYMFYVEDTATGTKIQALHEVTPSTIPTIDLDAVCFGFDPCVYISGGPGTTAGTFHPLAPTRILDTRVGLGISSAVGSGDGRNSDPNPWMRFASAINHELKVTGNYGVPASGVSAVLLNVTAVDAAAPTWLSVYPKPGAPSGADVFNDQSTFGAFPNTSNLNVDSATAVPNLVLARVGAGGKIRIANFAGPTHVIADIAGYFGTGGAHTGGDGFTGVVPDRLLDTRHGVGGPAKNFSAGETRSLQVAGVRGVPRNASSVVVNITATGAQGLGYVTAFPDGTGRPNASSLNFSTTSARANTSVVKVGANGRINLYVAESGADIIVDVLGSFGPSGGRITAINPQRIVDTRAGTGTHAAPMAPYETRSFRVQGVGGVPANATAVIANVTAVNPTSSGYLTAWPSGNRQPDSSNLNFAGGQTVPNLVMLQLGQGGIDVFNEAGSTHVLVDVMGYVS